MAALTVLEKKVLEVLKQQADDESGGSFGVIESVKWSDRKQLGGLLTSLQDKGVITVYEPHKIDGEKVTQFTINEEQ
jgi:hypothetical protein